MALKNTPPLTDTKNFTATEKKTKAIYIEQHKAYLKDKSIFDRFYGVAVNPLTYGVGESFFKGKHVLDVGCGNTAYFQKAMFDLGASHITCVDIGHEWMDELESALVSLGIPASFYTFVSASTVDLPFGKNEFDFVASNGVIMHLDGIDLAEKAFKELGRVTRPGGSLYAYVGISEPGIVDKYIVPSLRMAYREDSEFRSFIDNINPEKLRHNLQRYVDIARNNDKSIDIEGVSKFMGLFTLDTCTFLQNMLQVPVQQGSALGLQRAIPQLAQKTSEERLSTIGIEMM